MRYPISKPNRINLVRYYYELCLIPGLDLQIIRSSVNMLTSLLKFKRGSTLVLDPSELKLDWEPLWRVLRKELIPTKTLYDPSCVRSSRPVHRLLMNIDDIFQEKYGKSLVVSRRAQQAILSRI